MQILRGPDGKIQVRGLMPGQQLIQMPDGKLHVLSTNQVQQNSPLTTVTKTSTSPTKTVIKSGAATSSSKVQVVQGNTKMVTQSPSKQSPQANNTVLIRQQVIKSPVVQKVAPATPNAVVVSGGQVLSGQQIIVGQNQVVGAPAQVSHIQV